MSFPFGPHPTVEQFIEFAQSVGCAVSTAFQQEDGPPIQVIEISNPNNGRVCIVDMDLKERLAPSMVTYFQRRLGIKSGFPSAPEA